MTKMKISTQTAYSMIDKLLSQLPMSEALPVRVKILYGLAIDKQTKDGKLQLEDPKLLDLSVFYVVVRYQDGKVTPEKAIYEAQKQINEVVGWGADQVHLDEKDMFSGIGKKSNFLLFKLEGK